MHLVNDFRNSDELDGCPGLRGWSDIPTGSSLTANFTAPQKHCPLYFGLKLGSGVYGNAVCMDEEKCRWLQMKACCAEGELTMTNNTDHEAQTYDVT